MNGTLLNFFSADDEKTIDGNVEVDFIFLIIQALIK